MHTRHCGWPYASLPGTWAWATNTPFALLGYWWSAPALVESICSAVAGLSTRNEAPGAPNIH